MNVDSEAAAVSGLSYFFAAAAASADAAETADAVVDAAEMTVVSGLSYFFAAVAVSAEAVAASHSICGNTFHGIPAFYRLFIFTVGISYI